MIEIKGISFAIPGRRMRCATSASGFLPAR